MLTKQPGPAPREMRLHPLYEAYDYMYRIELARYEEI